MQGNGSKIRQGNICEQVPRSVQTSHEGKVIALCNKQMPTDRTISNNKPDITNRDNEMNMYVNRCCDFTRQKCYQERSREDYPILRPYNSRSTCGT
jgi:hypothetical protein